MNNMSTTRMHIVVPDDLARELDERVGKRGRSRFFTRAAAKELARLRLLEALEDAAGALADEDIPEWRTPEEATAWVRALRAQDEERLTSLRGQ
jgi:predicted transcriptional regulator